MSLHRLLLPSRPRLTSPIRKRYRIYEREYLGCVSGGTRLSDNPSVPDSATFSFACLDDRSRLIDAIADLTFDLLTTQLSE